MGLLHADGLKTLLNKKPARHGDGDGLYFRTLGKRGPISSSATPSTAKGGRCRSGLIPR
jgi:hypothetical protein